MTTDVVCYGETMAMVTPVIASPLQTASTFQIKPGGAESNVAMYLASLGHRVAWVGRLGDDPLGALVQREVAAAGVDVSCVEFDTTFRTGVYFKDPSPDGSRVYYYRENSAAAQGGRSLLSSIESYAPKVIHLTGITPALSPECDQMVERIMKQRRPGAPLVSFDVNFRRGLWSAEMAAPRLLELARFADVVFVGLDEAAALWQTRDHQEVRRLLPETPILVVKNGGDGATCYFGAKSVHVATPRFGFVETIGAGDAFASGWLSGLLGDRSHVDRLRLGHLLASVAMQSTADQRLLSNWDWLPVALAVSDDEWDAVLETTRSINEND